MYKSLLITLILVFSCRIASANIYEIKPNKIVVDTILLEAVGEPYEGQVAVAEVIRNRAMKRATKNGVSEAQICLSKLQFSCWNNKALAAKRLAKIDKNPEYRQIAERAWYEARRSNLTNGATSYCNKSVCNPTWSRKMLKTVKIGAHTFYMER